MNINKTLNNADAYLHDNRFPEAEALYQQALDHDPDHPHALHALALINYQRGNTTLAIELLERCISVKADFADAYNNLANIHAELNQPNLAITRYRQAIELNPNQAAAHYNLGVLLQSRQQLPDAVHHIQQALAIKPDFVKARNVLREILIQLAQATRKPDHRTEPTIPKQPRLTAEELCKRAALSQKQGRNDEAITLYRQAITIRPDLAETYNNLGNILVNKGRFRESLACFQSVIALEPDNFIGYSQLSSLLRLEKRWEDSATFIQLAIALEPQRSQLYLNFALILRNQGKLQDAATMCKRALQLEPDSINASLLLANILDIQGQLKAADELRRRVKLIDPQNTDVDATLLMTMNYNPEYSAEEIFEAAKTWGIRTNPKKRFMPPPQNVPDPRRRLRVGYVSGDFNNHPVGFFIEPILRFHDRVNYEIFCYYNDLKHDEYTENLQRFADHWRNTTEQSSEAFARTVRQDDIDILIDLSGHTQNNRLKAFALKPAPVQATWLGYIATTGLPAMDYIIADRFVIPIEDERYFVEKVLRLPHSFLCFTPPSEDIEVMPLPALQTGNITFGCFNKASKLTPEVIAVWSNILSAAPTSRLFLKSKGFDEESQRAYYLQLFAEHGISPERLKFAGSSPYEEYLAAYNEVDIGLDPFPYNGGTTTREALWMGVPTITLRGERFAGRMGEGIMMNLGLKELVADSREEYIAKAVDLAADIPSLAAVRGGLRERLLNSPLCDGPRFTRDLENAYRRMWETWCRNQADART